MKCEHEGCEAEAVGTIRIDVALDYDGGMCRSHLASWLRAKADEVEGVKECDHCEGDGYVSTYRPSGDFDACRECHGTGRVKA